ncbi:MAG: glutaredoxin [Hydrotalea flava]|uniref:thioredoxin family protein n=1 Tax=Hydrotalea TaxID=1004300 RepID=UPI000944F06C|nr:MULTISPECIES: thioredoxin family protein [Hydrotalea]NIM34649.1 glutaredoxin [Hydrotalea flava]NIM37491.1 glutaredoxin [Hydrotalea flava]NIN02659.1 glutaredoxin [Hydrotalea flava]NIN14334.1 glutaredoxin [Hydrotalea flava]NIO93417.1 glutaredoxin [Hydrotalea flava]
MKTQTKRKIELFTAGCTVCDPVVEMVKAMACSSCEVIIYNIAESCDTKECSEKVKSYGINTVPAIAVNGKLLSCCLHNGISVEELKSAGIGKLA